MPTVVDVHGREWIVEEIGSASGAVNWRPGERIPEPTLSILRLSSDEEQFTVRIGRGWREIDPKVLWEKISRARQATGEE